MGVADQLTNAGATATTYNPIPSAPSGVFRGAGDPGTLEDTEFADLRQDRVQVVTLSSFAGTDSFTLGYTVESATGTTRATSIAFVRGTNATAAAIQAELRTDTGDTALTVTGTTDEGPFTITHTKATFRRKFPRYVVNGTGCTGVVTYDQAAGEGAGVIGALGESDKVTNANTILKPTIGTITVTDGTDEVQSLDYTGTVSGGTFELKFRDKTTGALSYAAEADAVQAAFDALFNALTGYTDDDSPTVVKRGTNEVQTLTLSSWDNGDTIKLTYDGHESSAVTNPQADAAGFQAAIDQVLLLSDDFTEYTAGDCVVTRTNANVYVFTFSGAGVEKRNVGAITATSGTGSATGAVVETTPGVADGYTLTFENGALQGRPVDAVLVEDDSVTGGGSVAIVETTPGVLGSASIAYTENGGGSDVLATSVNDDTGVSYGFVKDAATPVVTGSLPPGDYHAILRTVESGRVSKADTKAFSVTST